MSFYTKGRVLAAEKSPRFQELKRPVRVNTFQPMKGLIPKSDEYAALVEDMSIDVVVFPISRVCEGAIGNYNADRTSDYATRRSERDLLDRIMVEYAHEVLVSYDRNLEMEAEVAGSQLSVRLIRKTIYHAIAKTYPELAQECFRQLDRRV